eukprot:TRINITY_DN7599_c0_g1_i2.p1 TRINITY_DN7599_c0_g1~~TRINITY_DN7599_c0_g1_i2.p1  ORF type:complete len:228 (+),score=60.95 TRINITY_DN7599_c0_g1_i2:242-925(+)
MGLLTISTRPVAAGGRKWSRSRLALGLGSAVVLVAAGVAVVVVLASRLSGDDGSAAIMANDLWGLHDLLLVGFSAVFEANSTGGKSAIQQAALNLTQMLPTLHPVGKCRTALSAIIANRELEGESLVAEMALASWECLPHQYTEGDFSATFSPECVSNVSLAKQAKNPKVLPPANAQLSSCRHSGWDRTCSYWSAIHTLALQAEANSVELLPVLVMVLWGGVTQCSG